MLGTLRMDVDACITEDRHMAPEIFPVEDTYGRSSLGKTIKLVRAGTDLILGRDGQRSSA